MSCLRKFQRNRFSFKFAKIYPRKSRERRLYITSYVVVLLMELLIVEFLCQSTNMCSTLRFWYHGYCHPFCSSTPSIWLSQSSLYASTNIDLQLLLQFLMIQMESESLRLLLIENFLYQSHPCQVGERRISWLCQCTGKQHKRPNVRASRKSYNFHLTVFSQLETRSHVCKQFGAHQCKTRPVELLREDTIRPNFLANCNRQRITAVCGFSDSSQVPGGHFKVL